MNIQVIKVLETMNRSKAGMNQEVQHTYLNIKIDTPERSIGMPNDEFEI